MLPLSNKSLPLANFDIFNRTYGPIGDSCPDCSGTSGYFTHEYQGDFPMGGMVMFFEPCPTCLGQELCPGCMQPLALSFDVSAFSTDEIPTYTVSWSDKIYPLHLYSYEDATGELPTNSFICLVCDWAYDPDRHYDYDEDPGFDPMFLM